MKAGDLDRAKEGISDGFLEALTAIGSPEEVRAGVARYARGRRHVALHRPGAADGLRSDARSRRPATRPTADCEATEFQLRDRARSTTLITSRMA